MKVIFMCKDINGKELGVGDIISVPMQITYIPHEVTNNFDIKARVDCCCDYDRNDPPHLPEVVLTSYTVELVQKNCDYQSESKDNG